MSALLEPLWQPDVPSYYVPLPDWMARAACRDASVSTFFPESRKGVAKNYTDALAACRGCRVRQECLDYALNEGLTDGVFGLTDRQRRRVTFARKAA